MEFEAAIAAGAATTCPKSNRSSKNNSRSSSSRNHNNNTATKKPFPESTDTCLALFSFFPQLPWPWPRCVRACPIKLPPAPARSGLQPVIPTGTVPAGQDGCYSCKDMSLGVERSADPFFRVRCSGHDGKYQVPEEDGGWPMCLDRTTTINPAVV